MPILKNRFERIKRIFLKMIKQMNPPPHPTPFIEVVTSWLNVKLKI